MSIVLPEAVPQLADSQIILVDQHVKMLQGQKRLVPSVLVPDLKGLSGVKEVSVFVSATEGFSCTVWEGIAQAKELLLEREGVLGLP